MVHPWHDLDPGAGAPGRLQVVIEIPRGSRNKYELDKKSGMFRFDRLLYSAVHYPGDYGFIPRTLAGDDDPLDVLVLTTTPTFTGCLVEVRPIGVFIMEDKGTDEKILAVPLADPHYSRYRELGDVAPHFLLEVEHFFRVYKDLEGTRVETRGWSGLERASEAIEGSFRRYEQLYGSRSADQAGPS